nr:hypothetical protein GCM10017611_82090 [Rhodococcus wratislaviensis]
MFALAVDFDPDDDVREHARIGCSRTRETHREEPDVTATLPERDDQIAHARRNPQPAYRVRPRARGVLHGSRRVMDLAPEVDVNGLNAPSEPVAVHVAAERVLPRSMVGREGDLAEAECDCLGGRTPSAGGIVMERAHLLRTPARNRDLRSPFQCRLAGG